MKALKKGAKKLQLEQIKFPQSNVAHLMQQFDKQPFFAQADRHTVPPLRLSDKNPSLQFADKNCLPRKHIHCKGGPWVDNVKFCRPKHWILILEYSQ